ncbi:retinol dehydrogenase 12 isoform X2 [Hippocampus zosterae]|uniref:retinol dehydrogenase 12 isoform X2 n=1 Tax=Hippocampus zosterae TaxID=109293 RepID=UPI00223E4E01|nr:retinol dehydrogenase 12 isoform X2 [Hippocampus zosterae]
MPDRSGFLVLPWPGVGSEAEAEVEVSEGRGDMLLRGGALLGAVLVICVTALRRWIGGGVCRSGERQDGKTVLVTGANTGIGKETCREMARRGARVVMACRDLSRADQAAEDIRKSTGNGNVVVRHLDLASLYSVRQFAKDFLDSEDRLDILINNAGVMMCPKWLTEDGFETQFAVNHLSHFLLTNLLLPKLKSSAPSRVVTVSSIAHRGGSGVSSFCVHPGVIRTELGRHVEGWFPLLGVLLRLPAMLLMKTPRQGSQTSLYCAITPGLEEQSGSYFSDCAVKEVAPEGRDDEVADRLWRESALLVGIKDTC